MDKYIKTLNRYLAKNPEGFASYDMNTLLDTLYRRYQQNSGVDTASVRAYFDELYEQLKKIAPDQADTVMEDATKLCSVYERNAFRQGLLVGFQLYSKLADPNT